MSTMKKILVVDDDVVIQKLLNQVLEREGYQLSSARDGIDAMVAIRKDRPDLVVLDIVMPHVNGYDVCRTIKTDPDLKTIPIILLTSREQEIDKRVLDLMGIEYLQKTCRPQDLVAKIKKILCPVILALFLFALPGMAVAAPAADSDLRLHGPRLCVARLGAGTRRPCAAYRRWIARRGLLGQPH